MHVGGAIFENVNLFKVLAVAHFFRSLKYYAGLRGS